MIIISLILFISELRGQVRYLFVRNSIKYGELYEFSDQFGCHEVINGQ